MVFCITSTQMHVHARTLHNDGTEERLAADAELLLLVLTIKQPTVITCRDDATSLCRHCSSALRPAYAGCCRDGHTLPICLHDVQQYNTSSSTTTQRTQCADLTVQWLFKQQLSRPLVAGAAVPLTWNSKMAVFTSHGAKFQNEPGGKQRLNKNRWRWSFVVLPDQQCCCW